MTTPTTRPPAHLHWSDCSSYSKQAAPFPACNCGASRDLESRAISMLTDDQAFASFGRWMEVVNAAKRARSLRDRLGVEEYIAAIYRSVPA